MTDASCIQFNGALDADELDALASLVAESLAGAGNVKRPPFTAPLLLFARLDGSLRHRLFLDRPGHVLVHEHLLIESHRPLQAGQSMQLSAEVPGELDTGLPIEISAHLATPAGETIAVMKAGLRHIAEEAMDSSAGFALERLVKADIAASMRSHPISASLIARYAKLAGDDNPLHQRDDAIVPGAFLAALAEYLATSISTAPLQRMSIRFMAPVRTGESVDLVLQMRSKTPEQSRLRLFYATHTRGVAAIADLVLSGESTRATR